MSKKRKSGPSNAKQPVRLPVIVFGTQRIGAIWALRNGRSPSEIVLATQGEACDALQKAEGGTVTVVRVSRTQWVPSTFPCEKRTAETEQALKAFEQRGGTIQNASLV